MRNRIAFGALVVSLVGAPTVGAAGKAPVVLSPASEWSLRNNGERCRLTRTFGAGADKLLVRMDRYRPGQVVTILIAGGALSRAFWGDMSLRFGPSGGQDQIGSLLGATVGDYKPGFYTTTMLTKLSGPPVGISWVEVVSRARPPIRLELGPMTGPIADLDKCTEGLVTHWGYDAEAMRQLTRWPSPTGNVGQWVTTDDYPRKMIAHGSEGTVQFRVDVDAGGKPTKCTVQEATDPVDFGEVVCAGVMKRATFDPALDQSGKPIAAYYASSARFDIRRDW